MAHSNLPDDLQDVQPFGSSQNSMSLTEEMNQFRRLDIRDWRCEDVFDWLIHVCRKKNIEHDETNLLGFSGLTGHELLRFNESDFLNVDPLYGSMFYKNFKKFSTQRNQGKLKSSKRQMNQIPCMFDYLVEERCDDSLCYDNRDYFNNYSDTQNKQDLLHVQDQSPLPYERSYSYETLDSYENNLPDDLSSLEESTLLNMNGISLNKMADDPYVWSIMNNLNEQDNLYYNNDCYGYDNYDRETSYYDMYSDCYGASTSRTESPSSSSGSSMASGKAKKERGPKLWEFLISLLKDPETNPTLIRWENESEGSFRFIQKDEIAKKWGERRKSDTLSYDYFARALRYHYKSQMLLPVPEKKLVYKFGPKVLDILRNMN